MTGVLEVRVRPEGHDQGRKEAEVLRADTEVGLLVVEDGQQVDLGDGLGVDQSPEVADHPHGRGLEYFILLDEDVDRVDGLSVVEVGLEDEVVVVHEVIPEERRHQELCGDAGQDEEGPPVAEEEVVEPGGAAGGGAEGGWEVLLDVLVARAVFTGNKLS